MGGGLTVKYGDILGRYVRGERIGPDAPKTLKPFKGGGRWSLPCGCPVELAGTLAGCEHMRKESNRD